MPRRQPADPTPTGQAGAGVSPAPAWWLAALLAALLGLALLCGGDPGQVASLEGGGLFLMPGGRAELPAWPTGWPRGELRLECAPGQDCAGLRARAWPTGPEVGAKGPGRFDLRRPPGQPWRVVLRNPGPRPLRVEGWRAVNFRGVNSAPPRLALLLGPPAASTAGQALLGALAAALMMAPALLRWWRQGRQRGAGLFWSAALPPLAAGAAGLGLGLAGLRLLLTWETLALLGLPALALALARRPLWAILLGLAGLWGLLLATLLGVGLPPAWFGPALVQERQFIYLCALAAPAQGLLYWALYHQRPAWFRPGQHPVAASLLWVGAPCLLFYLANGYCVYGGDTTYNGLLAVRLLGGHGLYYDQAWVQAHGGWGLTEMGPGYLPTFPMGPGFFGLPTALVQKLLGSGPEHLLAAWNQKVTAAWVAAGAAMVMFQLVWRLSGRAWLTGLLTAGFALGSSQLGISAASLWQHGPVVLLITLGLYCLLRGWQDEDAGWLALAGLPLGFLPLLRTQAVIFHLAGLAMVAWRRPRALAGFLLLTLPGLAAFLAINLGLYGSIFGGYAYQAHAANFPTSIWDGLAGSLFSPNRGLLVFSPFLILALGAWVQTARRQPALAWPLGLAMAGFLAIHAKFDGWYAGWCNGARYTSELVPVLVALLAWHHGHQLVQPRRWLLAGLVGLSILVNLPLHLFPAQTFQWNIFPNIDQEVQARVWDWRDWQPLHFRHFLVLGQGRAVPAFALVRNEKLIPRPDPELRYRVGVPLGESPQEALRVTNLPLAPGRYAWRLRGAWTVAGQARAQVALDVRNQRGRRQELAVPTGGAWELSYEFTVERRGWVDLALHLGGQGQLELLTAQISRLED